VIPRTHPAANAAGFGILNAWPTETIAGPITANENGLPNAVATGPIVDAADMFTLKAEHKFTDRSSLSGLYIYNKTDEPGSTIMKPDAWYIASQDNFFGPLRRRPHVLVFNNTNIINDTTVLSLRYGWSTWQDACDKQPYSAGIDTLGFSSNYTNALSQKDVFPDVRFDDATVDVGGWGAIPNRWKSPYSINGSLSKLMGSHSVKVGADMRRLGVATVSDTQMGGRFDFNSLFHQHGTASAATNWRACCSACPTPGRAVRRRPFEWFTKYYGAYVQDDWRVSERLTLNYGLRLEHEDGLREIENRRRLRSIRTRPTRSTRCAEDRTARGPHASRAA
jgi:outer membrane receptor protein involved in Fe transport